MLFYGVQLPGDVILDPMAVPPFNGIDKETVDHDAEVKVIPARQSGLSRQCDDIPFGDGLFRFYIDVAEVGIGGGQSLSVIEDYG